METKLIESKFTGKTGKIISQTHPHYGEIAICLGAKRTEVGYGFVMRNEELREEFFIFLPSDIIWNDALPTPTIGNE